MTGKVNFASDYCQGCHPAILDRLVETNMDVCAGYGTDERSAAARDAIRSAFGCPGAEVQFLVGGTQTNATVAAALLRLTEGIVCADSGHIATHEAGAIEAGGHKVLTIPNCEGKIRAEDLARSLARWEADLNHDQEVAPAMVYISQPTEYGTLYSYRELKDISEICRAHGLIFYMDGARLAYGLASPEHDIPLEAYAELLDAFYIGGTKCGALFGEALVVPDPTICPRLFSIIKCEGALVAKGFVLGVQFEALFRDGLYFEIGRAALEGASIIAKALEDAGIEQAIKSPTNQLFPVLTKEAASRLLEKLDMSFWDELDDGRVVYRIATSWATTKEEAEMAALAIRSL